MESLLKEGNGTDAVFFVGFLKRIAFRTIWAFGDWEKVRFRKWENELGTNLILLDYINQHKDLSVLFCLI